MLQHFFFDFQEKSSMRRHLPRVSKSNANENIFGESSVIPCGDISEEDLQEEDGNSSENDCDEENITDERRTASALETSERIYRWRRRSNAHFPVPFVSSVDSSIQSITPQEEPYEMFKEYISDEMFSFMADQTNLYSVQMSGRSVCCTSSEMEQLFGIWLYMGICSAPSYRDYWARETRWDCVADVMPVNRYEKLMQYFHLSDNNEQIPKGSEGYDPLFKIRKLFDVVRNKCRLQTQSEFQSIDEQMIPYKGNHSN
ncbi:MAG: hypothetical protein AAGK05_16170, partial [Pseudomonadota bacterium]